MGQLTVADPPSTVLTKDHLVQLESDLDVLTLFVSVLIECIHAIVTA